MTKLRTSQLRTIDVRFFSKQGLLNPVDYRRRFARDGYTKFSDDVLEVEFGGHLHTILVTQTATQFGGKRDWFQCPICTERVALLYLIPPELACRTCSGAAYVSQLERQVDRGLRKARNIRVKLNWSTNFLDGHGPKPRGMHWQTFERLVDVHDRAHMRWIGSMSSKFCQSLNNLDDFNFE